MDLKQIRYFVTVVEEGSINQAARKLHMTQPPVSKQMQLLEDELGCPLFLRSTHPLELTQEMTDEAAAAGADFVGAEEMVAKIQNENWFGFDVCITTPDMMGVVGRIAGILGPKGLMPNPKSGTVTMDVAKAVNDAKAGKVEYRLDKTAVIHVIFGKKSFGVEKLEENFSAIMDAIVKAKPAAAKGTYLKSVAIASTMGPGIKVNYRAN